MSRSHLGHIDVFIQHLRHAGSRMNPEKLTAVPTHCCPFLMKVLGAVVHSGSGRRGADSGLRPTPHPLGVTTRCSFTNVAEGHVRFLCLV